jgi:thioredoxin-like negative regulator of GroEL
MKHAIKRLFSIATILKLLLITSISAASTGNSNKDGDNNIKVISITNDTFKQMVFNYETNKDWKFERTVPAIIDFYAGLCAPCSELSECEVQAAFGGGCDSVAKNKYQ